MKELLPGLPPYEGGCVSPEIYNAGQGLHARPNDERPIRRETKRSKAEFLYELELITRFGVKVDRLTEDGENLRLEISNGEDRYRVERTADELFVETLTHRPMDRPTLARLVTDTTREAFFAYLDRLKALGYESVWQNRIDQNECCQLAGSGRLLYACFNGATGQARFIDDPVSERVDTFGSPAPEHPVKTQICQFSLYYDYNMHKRGLGIDCGMLYIVRLPDRSLFLVDGGEMEQATEAAMPELLRVMREMAGAGPGEKIRVAAWFCTHGHDDHMDVFTKFLRLYHDQMELERVIFNFAAYQRFVLMSQVFPMLERLTAYYPNVRYLKAHSGQSFSLAGVRFDVLYTHEDLLMLPGTEDIRDFNETSTVLKLSFEGVSFLLTGDINHCAVERLLANYRPETLHADLVQAAHHLHNDLPELYTAIRPGLVVVPQDIKALPALQPKYRSLLLGVDAEHVLFDEGKTMFFEERNGAIALTHTCPQVGGLYDGSDV